MGPQKLQEKLGIGDGECTPDGKSVYSCRCVGACGLAPATTANDDGVRPVSPVDAELDAILAKYVVSGPTRS